MNKLQEFRYHWGQWKKYLDQDKAWQKCVFYAESRNDWTFLKPTIEFLLSHENVHISFLTSDDFDPNQDIKSNNLRTFHIGSGYIRTIVFKLIPTKVLVMTLSDLKSRQLKKSVNPVHYVYLYHALVSTHMVYREKAFDHYDTILCVGPYQIKEIRKREALFSLKPKRLIPEQNANSYISIKTLGLLPPAKTFTVPLILKFRRVNFWDFSNFPKKDLKPLLVSLMSFKISSPSMINFKKLKNGIKPILQIFLSNLIIGVKKFTAM